MARTPDDIRNTARKRSKKDKEEINLRRNAEPNGKKPWKFKKKEKKEAN